MPVLAGAMAYSDVVVPAQALPRPGSPARYDGISIHPYSDGRGPGSSRRPPGWSSAPGSARSARPRSRAHAAKPLWLTEFGYTACTSSECATPAEQADLLAQSVLALPQFPYVRGATVYQLRDMTTDPGSWEANFGLVQQDFVRRPAFAAVRSAIGSLRSRRR